MNGSQAFVTETLGNSITFLDATHAEERAVNFAWIFGNYCSSTSARFLGTFTFLHYRVFYSSRYFGEITTNENHLSFCGVVDGDGTASTVL